jgi:hypothetical protein
MATCLGQRAMMVSLDQLCQLAPSLLVAAAATAAAAAALPLLLVAAAPQTSMSP